jgi:hypothetical protein
MLRTGFDLIPHNYKSIKSKSIHLPTRSLDHERSRQLGEHFYYVALGPAASLPSSESIGAVDPIQQPPRRRPLNVAVSPISFRPRFPRIQRCGPPPPRRGLAVRAAESSVEGGSRTARHGAVSAARGSFRHRGIGAGHRRRPQHQAPQLLPHRRQPPHPGPPPLR